MIIDDIAVVMAFDVNYARYGFTVLQSILNHSQQSFSFFILHENLNESAQDLGRQLFNTPRSTIHFIDVTHHFGKSNLLTPMHFTRTIYYRLSIPKLFKEFDKVIYLDSDVIVNRDLAHLLHDMNDQKAIGAVRDTLRKMSRTRGDAAPPDCGGAPQEIYERHVLGMKNPDRYFQSGVLVFNIPRISTDKVERCFRMLEQPLWLPDQDILNAVFEEDTYLLSERWNMVSTPPSWGPSPAESPDLPSSWKTQYKDAFDHPYIIHYPGEPKPWHNAERPYIEPFNKVLKQVNRAFSF